jgi:nitroimidazol reductase NimA-like FMN-containing flavoprotein (pyridoxamine 5'-phosphate oxidase superfamily)
MFDAILEGKTFSGLLDEIEVRFTSITSIILSRKLFHQSKNYKSGVYKGFKILLDN